MVKVLTCYHFTSQEVFTTDHEPLALCTSQDKLFVATAQCSIEVYSLAENTCKKYHTFPTVSPIIQMLYNEIGNYIVTLEVKTTRTTTFNFARVYVNWLLASPKQPMKVRVAGHVTNTSQSDTFEVIEIPVRQQPVFVATCPSTGNLAVATDGRVYLYSVCNVLISRTTQMVQEAKLLMEFQFSFPIQEIALCENYLACCSAKETQVVKTRLIASESSSANSGSESFLSVHHEQSANKKTASREVLDDSSTHRGTQPQSSPHEPERSNRHWLGSHLGYSRQDDCTPSASPLQTPDRVSLVSLEEHGQEYIVEDENHVTWTFNDLQIDHQVGTTTKQRTLPKTIHLRSFQDVRSWDHRDIDLAREVWGPVSEVSGCPIIVILKDCVAQTVDGVAVSTCLYKKFLNSDTSQHSIQLVPVFSPETADLTVIGSVKNPLQSTASAGLIGLTCLVTTHRMGYLYDIYNKTQLLSTYPYTSDAYKVLVDPHFLYAMTSVGVETYTARGVVAAMTHAQDVDLVHNTLPPANLDICLIGLQPFISLSDVCVGWNHVVLLSKANTGSEYSGANSWSLYALKNSSALDLYGDMMEQASFHKDTSSPAYVQLLLEGHLLLRSQAYFHGTDPTLQKLLQDTATLLGHYYARPGSTCPEQAVPYYNMSDQGVRDVVDYAQTRAEENLKQGDQPYGEGLIRYLDHVIFHREEDVPVNQEIANTILKIYSLASPEKLPSVMLSNHLHGYDDELAVSLLQEKLKVVEGQRRSSRKLYVLALAVLQLRVCEPAFAEASLLSLSKSELVEAFCANHQILHYDYTQFSHIAQLLRRHKPGVFLDILISLHDLGVITMELAISLLQNGAEKKREIQYNSQLQEYLEKLLNSQRRQYAFPDGSKLLCNIYLSKLHGNSSQGYRLSASSNHQHIPRGSGHFAKRQAWINDLPPFCGNSNFKKPCLFLPKVDPARSRMLAQGSKVVPPSNTESSSQGACYCCCCNEDLLKLQSLLCSKYTSECLAQHILDSIADARDIQGRDSLELLALVKVDPPKAAGLVLDIYPKIIAAFAQESWTPSNNLGPHIVDILVKALRGKDEMEGDTASIFIQALKDVLTQMAATLKPAEFLNILPYDGSVNFFLPYVKSCCRRNAADDLKHVIMEKGAELKSSQ